MTAPAKLLSEAARRDAEAELVRSARTYDLAALVAVLRGLGYGDGAIEFRSKQTTMHQGSVVDAVEFHEPPQPRAIITVNVGLLGPQSPLPAYFQKVLDKQADSSLSAFLNFFSHRLLRGDVLGMFPERNPELFSGFARTKRQLLSLLGLRSLSTMHWLFESLFPELEVAVRRTVLQRPVRTRGMVVGDWGLGDGSVLGGTATAPVSAVQVTLYCDEPMTGDGQPWARAADQRLRGALFPIVCAHGLFLAVHLVFRDQSTFLTLAPQQFLGYEPLAPSTSETPAAKQSRTVILFSGEVAP